MSQRTSNVLTADLPATLQPDRRHLAPRAAALAAALTLFTGVVLSGPAASASVPPGDPSTQTAASATGDQHDGLRATQHYYGDGLYFFEYGF